MKTNFSVALVAITSAVFCNGVAHAKELPPIRVAAEETLPAIPVDPGVLKTYEAIKQLEKAAIDKLVAEYRLANSKWPNELVYRALLVAASTGHLPAQAELVKCCATGGYGAPSSRDETVKWLNLVKEKADVALIKSMLRDLDVLKDESYYVRALVIPELQKHLEELNNRAVAQQQQSAPDGSTSSVAEGQIPVRNANGTLTDAFVNHIVKARIDLLLAKKPTGQLFAGIFADEVLELSKSEPVSRAKMVEKAQSLDNEWPNRAIEVLSVGVQGFRIEVNITMLYKNAKGEEISAYNKITLLTDADGKIVGMMENITTGSKPKLTPKFNKFPYAGPKISATAQ